MKSNIHRFKGLSAKTPKDFMKKLYEHRWPIVVILLCALGIYYILSKKEYEYYENIFEHFEERERRFSKEELLNAMTNPDYTFMLANGHWTSESSDIKKDRVTNSYKIHVSKEGKGKITLNKDEYKINLFTNMKISGIHTKNKNKMIQFEFLILDKDLKNPLRQENVPRAKVSIYQNDKLLTSFYSYKLFELHGVGGELSRIILSQNYYEKPQLKYDIHTYQKYIGNFKYPFKAFTITYGNISSGTFFNKIKKDYDDKIILAYKREYYTHGKETLMTPLSKTYELNGINRQNKLFSEITLSNIEEENRINMIRKGFIPKATYIYIFKVKSVKNKYSFQKTMNENKGSFHLLNNATSIFSKNMINLPILNETLLTMEGTYTPILLKTVKMSMKDEKMKIKITSKEVEKVL